MEGGMLQSIWPGCQSSCEISEYCITRRPCRMLVESSSVEYVSNVTVSRRQWLITKERITYQLTPVFFRTLAGAATIQW